MSYSAGEMIRDINQTPSAPAILILIGCNTHDFGPTIKLGTATKVVVSVSGQPETYGGGGDMLKRLANALVPSRSIREAVSQVNGEAPELTEPTFELSGDATYQNMPLSQLISR